MTRRTKFSFTLSTKYALIRIQYFTNEDIITHHEEVIKKKQELEKQIKSIQSKIKKLPAGKITCAKNGNGYKWYRSDGKNRTYIRKEDRSLAEKLAWKKYLSFKLEDLKQKHHILKTYTRLNKTAPDKAEKLLTNPGYQELLTPFLQLPTIKSTDWMKEPYHKNPNYPEHLTLKSISGNIVRSKSELLIDTFLYNNKIPFRYECALELNGITIYPDFTIPHPLTQESIIGNTWAC